MKIFKVLSAILILTGSILPQARYYYQGREIQLEPRKDKIAVILNSTSYSKQSIENVLKSKLSAGDKLTSLTDDLYLINLSSPSDNSVIGNKISSLEGNKELVKFATFVYYGESKKVTQIPTDEFIVRLNSMEDIDRLKRLNEQFKCTILHNIGDEKGFLLKTGNGIELNALYLSDYYYSQGIFEYCEPNFGYPEGCLFNYTPNDPFYSSQWPLNNTGQTTPTEGYTTAGDLTSSAGIPGADMDVSRAWDIIKGNSNVKVAVFDTGIDSLHPDFAGNLLQGYDAFSNVSSVPSDPGSHGTCTAGIIGAVSNNSLGVSGIAGGDGSVNSGCKIMSIKLVNSSGAFTTSANIARGFDTARTRNVHVSSNSWGGGSPAAVLTNAINNLANNSRGGLGCVVLFSSGNDGHHPPSYPSYLASVVCVGASTRHDQKKAPGTGNQFYWGGNYGEDVNGDIDLVAPTITYTTDRRSTSGYNTTSGTAGDYYSTFNGTSCSCPEAAGVAALIFSLNPNYTRAQVLDYLYRGCEKIENVSYSTSKTYGYWNSYYGYGRVNAYYSLRLAQGNDLTPPSIMHTNPASHSSTYPTTVSADIVDQDGSAVLSTGTNRPKLLYRINKNNSGWSAFDSVYYDTKSTNTYTFKIPGAGYQTEIQYYIKAQDNSSNSTTFPLHASTSYPYTLCYYAVGNITTESQSLGTWAAPDNNFAASSSLNFGSSYSVLEASVVINLSHTFVSEETLILWSPNSDANNNRVALFSTNGGSGDNITNATVKDSATQFFGQGTPPYSGGTYKPEYILSSLNGTNAQGNWRFISYDGGAGDAPTFNSLQINLKHLNGTLSPNARLDSPLDSTLDFGTTNPTVQTDKNFYLKNNGTSNLNISSVSFTGTYASNFSVINSYPASIAPGDSGLFTVRYTPGTLKSGTNEENNLMATENAVMQISNNDPSKPVYKVSIQSQDPLPVEITSFTGTVKGNKVNLNWRTSQEVNNYGFEIERTGINPLLSQTEETGTFNKIGFMTGAGNSNSDKEYSFTDISPLPGKSSYRLKQIDLDGAFAYSSTIEITVNTPEKFELAQNYPNPFNPATVINYQLSAAGKTVLKVYDVLGKEIITLVNGEQEPGKYVIQFDGSNLPSGIYIYKLNSGEFNNAKKMLLMK